MDKILILDNYDSFTYNLYHLVQSVYKGQVDVRRDYEIDMNDINIYKALIISPGPGRPETTPMAMELIKVFHKKIPILGICLGLQCINYYFGGKTVEASYPVHGKRSELINNQTELYKNLPKSFYVARYHSLTIEAASDINITGKTKDNVIMSLQHETLPIYGLQYHPESFLSQYGKEIIINFLDKTGIQK